MEIKYGEGAESIGFSVSREGPDGTPHGLSTPTTSQHDTLGSRSPVMGPDGAPHGLRAENSYVERGRGREI